ncbi:MAG: hypothetical protein ABH871_01090 [Pseudomonadota bacterium]
MGVKMSWEEMKKTYPNEWVAIIDPEGDTESPFGAICGEVITHNPDETEFTGQLKKSHLHKCVDIRYTGDVLPDNPVGPILWQISNTNS